MAATDKPRVSAHCDPKITAHNRLAFIVDGASFNIGSAFLEGNTVLPTFVRTLTSSPLLIGMVSAVRGFGYLMPQIFVAGYIENRPMKKPFMMKVGYVMRAAGILMALSALIAKSNPNLALPVFFGALVVFSFSDGLGGLPWMDIVARTIPPDRRGRLFGTQQAVGGTLSFLSGFLIRQLLNQDGDYPMNYFMVMALGAFFMCCSLAAMHFILDPGGPAPKTYRSLRTYLRELPTAWSDNPRFRQLMVTRLLTGSLYLCLPFFAIHAQTDLDFPVSVVGLFVSAQMVGTVVGGPIWGCLGDRHGPYLVIRFTALITMATPFLALGARLVASLGIRAVAYFLYFLLYVCIGGFFGGTWIGFSNYVFDISEESNRATLMGLYNTIGAPLTLLTMVGGWILQTSTFPTLFAIVAAIEVVACSVAFRLPKSREVPSNSSTHTL